MVWIIDAEMEAGGARGAQLISQQKKKKVLLKGNSIVIANTSDSSNPAVLQHAKHLHSLSWVSRWDFSVRS